jgi:type IV secretion system protein VirB9
VAMARQHRGKIAAPSGKAGAVHPASPSEKGSDAVAPHGVTDSSSTADRGASDPDNQSRVIHYSAKDVVKLKTKLRFSTLLILPKSEKLLDFTVGDREFWVIEGNENFAYIKPAKAGAQTNLNLITASGNIYSFTLTEVSESADSEPDLKVFVELKDDSMLSAATGGQRFVSATEIEKCRNDAAAAQEETKRVKQITDETIQKGIAKILKNVRCAYEFSKGKKPFYVWTICHDDKFTYVRAAPEETPTIYEVREGPNIVNFTYEPYIPTALDEMRPNSGILTIHKVVERGYLAIGKERLNFSIKE